MVGAILGTIVGLVAFGALIRERAGQGGPLFGGLAAGLLTYGLINALS